MRDDLSLATQESRRYPDFSQDPVETTPAPTARRAIDLAGFSSHFERVRQQLPQLFADQWVRWEQIPGTSAYHVYNAQDRIVLELCPLRDGSWYGALIVRDRAVSGRRDQAIHLVLKGLGLL